MAFGRLKIFIHTMTITLSRADYDQLWQQANLPPTVDKQSSSLLPPETPSSDPQEVRSRVPAQLGKGYIHTVQARGIHIILFDYQFHDDVLLVGNAPAPDPICREIGFNLSGNLGGKRTGESFIEWGLDDDDEDKTSMIYANDRVRKVDIHLDAAEALIKTVNQSLETLPKSVSQEITSDSWISEVNVLTPAMRAALEQIFQCPFHSETKQLYLESKCLELVALKLEQLKTRKPNQKRACYLCPEDIERIHFAKDILVEQSQHPPSLMALARQVSLNDYKLKVGFRQVFGTTVFGYLHQHRMEEAHRLLAEQQLNVKQVAQAVGYTNQSQFAAAFRKQFGINPKAYALSLRI